MPTLKARQKLLSLGSSYDSPMTIKIKL